MQIRILRVLRPHNHKDLVGGVLAFVVDEHGIEHRVRYRTRRGWQCSLCPTNPCSHIRAVEQLIDPQITQPTD